MPKVPSRLDKDPIVEATFEFRFQGKTNTVADVLHGAMYPALKARFPKIQRNPISAFATEFLDDPQLRYQSRLILRGDNVMVHIGDRAVAITSLKPYLGWTKFRPLILEILQLVRDADVVKEGERISMRYTNLIVAETPREQFSRLNFKASLGRQPYNIQDNLTHVRTEVVGDEITTIIEIGANTVAKMPDGQVKGVGIAVDSIHAIPSDFLANPGPHVAKIHEVDKNIFFNLITEQALNEMGPHWD